MSLKYEPSSEPLHISEFTLLQILQTLEDVEGRAGTFLDVLLHPGTGLIAFVGSFLGLQ